MVRINSGLEAPRGKVVFFRSVLKLPGAAAAIVLVARDDPLGTYCELLFEYERPFLGGLEIPSSLFRETW